MTITVDEDTAVRAVLDRIYAAWDAGDADAFVAPYAEHATATLPGSYLPNREAIRTTMATLFAGDLNGSRGVHEVREIRFVGTDAAVVTSTGGIVMKGETEPAAQNRALETWTLSKHDGTWRVQAFHNCPAN